MQIRDTSIYRAWLPSEDRDQERALNLNVGRGRSQSIVHLIFIHEA